MIGSWSEYLQTDFKSKSRKNSSFSLRSYAKLLKISPSHLSLILSNKRKVSPASAMKIATQLGITPSETIQRLQNLDHKFSESFAKEINTDEFKLISEWYHFGILGLAELKTNVANPKWIAQKLGISVPVASQAFQNLQKHGYLEVKGGQFRFKEYLATKSDVSSADVRQFHKQALNLATLKIEEVDVEFREFISMTFAMNKKNIKMAKSLIRKFKNEFEREMDTKTKTDVFQLGIQFFPLTEVKGNS